MAAKRNVDWTKITAGAGRFIIEVYYAIMMIVFPFYIGDGYRGIGKVKYAFFSYVSLVVIGMMLFISVLLFFLQRKKVSLMEYGREMSGTDWFAHGYLIAVLLSYLCTAFKEEALWGAEGWQMGFISQLIFISIYFLFSRYGRWNEKMLYLAFGGSGLVFLLGILNRYSIYPIEMYGQQPGFISTLGNINWFCGYWSVLGPLGVFWYWNSEKRWQQAAAGFYTVIVFLCGVTQGSSSAYLVLAAIFVLLFALSFDENRKMCRFLEICMLFALSCQIGRICRYLPGFTMNYENELGMVLTDTNVTLYIGVLIGICYLLFRVWTKRQQYDIKNHQGLRRAVIALIVLLCLGYPILLAANTCLPGGLPGLSDVSVFVFNDTWASSRGATWISGIRAYRSMSPLQKLVGVGADCFTEYVYGVPELAEYIYSQFGNNRLTNAHNEWITMLVNQGALGLFCYAGIFLSAFLRFLKQAKRQPLLYLCAASVMAYTVHNIVSFQQVLNAPLVFIVLGIGEGILRNVED